MTRPDLLTIDDLVVDYGRSDKNAVDGVSLSVREGETLGLVGESGSGKSSIARAALGLTPYRGSIRFQGQELHTATKAQWHTTRGRLQMIFQDPYSTLDPRIRIGVQIAEPFLVHKAAPRTELPVEVASLLERVGLDPAMARRYPHEFSGGQRQRIAIARAIALHPTLIVCDEPTSALDVSVQAQVLTLLEELQREQNIAYLFIAHNLGVVRRISHRVAVMYLGQIIETGPTDEVFRNPQHPYTRALLDAVLEPAPAERHRAHLAPSDLTSPIDLATRTEES
ncbi:MAG: peptide ABC transporter substrate-binding protein [Microbacterium sp.]|uniref:ATP-binding cassette domain-containing protein n=1 Tax=Microbacterium sp. TaxID=51671 RepID=UPI000C4FC884|nr:ATP-binding cassette domain-containing protein [Microbacterium sp.]MAY51235.1 peptide ABC transporter substrate-binding protein [Microbacterium sp.]